MPEEKVEEVAKPEVKGGGMMQKVMFVIAITLASSLSGGVVSWIITTRTLSSISNPAKEAQPASKEPPKQEDAVAEALEKGGVLPMDPFVVNLADPDSARYLRIKVSLMLNDKTGMQQIQDNQALQIKLRDVILQTLTQKTSQDLNNEEGKNKLRHEIQTKVEGYFKNPKLVDVMFTDFVIQL